MLRKSFVLFCLIALCANKLASAAEDCVACISPMRLDFRHIEANGIGYRTGYTTAGFFASLPQTWCNFSPFIDLRGHVFNDGKWAANVGIGARSLGQRIYGANLYYDYRQVEKEHFNQLGLGLESLGTRWDFRMNGYLPVGRKKTPAFDKKHVEICAFDAFSGNSILTDEITITRKKIEFAMSGVDAEVGFHLLRHSDCMDLLAAIGPYYFHGEFGKHALGGKARFVAQFNDYLALEGITSYDNLFHGIVQGQVTLSIPLGSPRNVFECRQSCLCDCCDADVLAMRFMQPVQRDEIIVASRKHKKTEDHAIGMGINPATGLPVNAIFVNNTNPNPGDGTFENPFNQLLLAQAAAGPGSLIYVFEGDGTTNGMNLGFLMKDNQILIGSGNPISLPSSCGPITIPAMTPGMPSITNAGDVIVLANNDTIIGFNIEAPSGAGIFGNAVNGLQIANNTITNPNMTSGILLSEVSGLVGITQNNLIGSFGIFVNGIDIENTTTHSTLFITQNQITSYFTGVLVFADNTSEITSFVNQNFVTKCISAGIDLDAFNNATHTMTIAENTVTDSTIMGPNTGAGIIAFSDSTVFNTATIENNSLQNNQLDGVAVGTDLNAGLAVTVQNNTFVGNGGTGALVTTSNNLSNFICLKLANNTSDNGYTLTNNGASQFNAVSPDGTLSGLQAINIGTITPSGGVMFVLPGSPNCP